MPDDYHRPIVVRATGRPTSARAAVIAWLRRRRRGVALSDTDRAGVMFLLADVRGTVETVAGVLADEPGNPRAAYLAGQLAGLVDRLDRFEERFYAGVGQ